MRIRTATIGAASALALLATPTLAAARGGHRGLSTVHHGHPINSWMGSQRLRLR
jgi:hypothetical protein